MLATANTGKKPGEVLRKNAGEWTGRVEISKEQIHGSKRSMYGYILTYSQALKGERLSYVFSPDGALISASAAPHCGAKTQAVKKGWSHWSSLLAKSARLRVTME